jgi:hypothetical protein
MDFLNLKINFFNSLFDDKVVGCIEDFNTINLESEQQQEGHHKTEKSHSFGQGETQDGI